MDVKVKEIMSYPVINVSRETSVKEIAEIMLEENIGGVPVVDQKGEVVGIVTEEDLIMKDVKLRFPTYIQFLDAVIYLESVRKYEEELRKALGAKAEDVMTRKLVTVSPEDDIGDASTLMVEKGISRLLVMDGKKLVGIVTKRDLMRAIAEEY